MGESELGDIIGLLFALIPIVLVALVLRGVRIIRINSDLQIEQNKEMIAILREIAEKKWYIETPHKVDYGVLIFRKFVVKELIQL